MLRKLYRHLEDAQKTKFGVIPELITRERIWKRTYVRIGNHGTITTVVDTTFNLLSSPLNRRVKIAH